MDDKTASGTRIMSPRGPFNLLSLDGGGVKGISSLMILDAIMKEVATLQDKPPNDPAVTPSKYFDLAGGTSTGGLAALMMFRLNLSTTETMKHYDDMSQKIFSPTVGTMNLNDYGIFGRYLGSGVSNVKAVFQEAKFSAGPLRTAINTVVGETLKTAANAKSPYLLDNDSPKMFMCSTFRDKGESMLFRSYQPPDMEDAAPVSSALREEDFSDITIEEAALATSAAPTYLPEAVIKRSNKEYTFWDGGLLNNNPIDQVWSARFDLVGRNETPIIGSVLSIGTSWSETKAPSGWFLKRFTSTVLQTIAYATNTEAKHRDFKRDIGRENKRLPPCERTEYFRFNVPTGEEHFDLDDWQSMTKLQDLTAEYLKDAKVKEDIKACAKILAKRSIPDTN